MLVSIEKELQKQVSEQKEKFRLDPVKEVENILNSDLKNEVEFLSKVSPNSLYKQNQSELDQHKIFESIEKKFGGNVFTKNQIKNISIKYKLRFISSRFYAGDFLDETGFKLRSFCKDYKIKETELSNNFYILAPSEILHLVGDMKYNMNIDPILFYKIDENHYRLVHKWGNDFTILRRLVGFRWKNFEQYWLFNTAMILPLFLIGFTILNFGVPSTILLSIILSALTSHLVWNNNKINFGRIDKGKFTTWNWDTLCNFKD